MLAIQSSLPTGWDSTQYERSDMYAIPLVVSFALVIALMIGSLIGALVIRRSKSRSRRRKKRIIQGDDDSAREKVAQSSLVSRVGRALRHRDQPDDSEEDPRTELEHRVKSWARRSAAWRVQARVGVRRRMGRGRKRSQADNQPGSISGAIQEDPEAEEREATRAPTPVQSRAPTPTPNTEPAPSAAPNYSSPVVPTYSSSPDAGPSTPITRPEPRADPMTRMEAHPDATPSDEPAYDDPGAGQGLPPAYRGGGLSEVARGKRPAHTESESTPDPAPEPEQRPEERRVWTELDAYAFGQEGGGEAVTAHVATDDKRVLERLHLMRGAPEGLEAEEEVHAPREEDVFGSVTPGGSDPSSSAGAGVPCALPSSEAGAAPLPETCGPPPMPETGGGVLPSSGTGILPLPPTKTGTGPVARYGEADLSLPRYLDGQEGISGPGVGVPSAPGIGLGVPSAPGGMEGLEGLVPSAPPCEEEIVLPSAPVLEDEETPGPSAPPLDEDSVASAPSLGGDSVASAPPMTSSPNSVPSAPPLDDHSSASTSPSTPLHDDDALHPDDKTALRPPSPQLRRLNSSSPLLSEERSPL